MGGGEASQACWKGELQAENVSYHFRTYFLEMGELHSCSGLSV